MTLYLASGRPVQLSGEELGNGSEGTVIGVEGTRDLCAKLYYEPPTDGGAKLDALIASPLAHLRGDHPEHHHLAWPLARLVDDDGATRGVLIPRVDGVQLTKLFDPALRANALAEPTWRTALITASRTGRLVSTLHNSGVVLGDISPANLMLSHSGHVTLIDCDTVQLRDPSGHLHLCPKITPEYAPPEALGLSVPALDEHHDSFGLAVMICQILMEGQHPYEGVPSDDTDRDDLESNIRLRRNRITRPELLKPMAGEMPTSLLPPAALELARQCFEDGHDDPARRPSPEDWFRVLDRCGFELMGCRFNPRHLYHRSLSGCVWCSRIALGAGESYPTESVPTATVGPDPWGPPHATADQGSGWQTPPPNQTQGSGAASGPYAAAGTGAPQAPAGSQEPGGLQGRSDAPAPVPASDAGKNVLIAVGLIILFFIILGMLGVFQ